MSAPIRVLVLSPWGMGGGYSGPVTLLDRLFEAVSDTGAFSIDVAFRDRGDEIVPGWATRVLPLVSGSRSRFSRREQLLWLLRSTALVLRTRHDYDVVHLHGTYILNLAAGLAAGRRAALLPVLERGDLALPARGGRIKGFIQRLVAQRALVGFALSPGIADELRGAGLDDRAVIALPNAVDISVFGGASRTVLRRGAVRLGFVGKLGPTKDPLILVDAVRILRSQGIDAAAVFVGPFVDASFGRVFKRGVAERGLEEHVTLVGFADDVHERMRHDMDVFVLASHAEGLPGALVEAMAGGLPSVVTDVGSMALHVRASQSGRVVAHSAEAVALAASELSMSPEQWSRASLAASQYAAENFSSARVAEIYMSAVTHRLQEI